jgi:hypothetical protein
MGVNSDGWLASAATETIPKRKATRTAWRIPREPDFIPRFWGQRRKKPIARKAENYWYRGEGRTSDKYWYGTKERRYLLPAMAAEAKGRHEQR